MSWKTANYLFQSHERVDHNLYAWTGRIKISFIFISYFLCIWLFSIIECFQLKKSPKSHPPKNKKQAPPDCIMCHFHGMSSTGWAPRQIGISFFRCQVHIGTASTLPLHACFHILNSQGCLPCYYLLVHHLCNRRQTPTKLDTFKIWLQKTRVSKSLLHAISSLVVTVAAAQQLIKKLYKVQCYDLLVTW